MCNNVRGNVIYCDTPGSDFDTVRQINGILLHATANNASLIIKDRATGGNNILLQMGVVTANESLFYDFNGHPIITPDGIEVDTVSNCVVTIIMGK